MKIAPSNINNTLCQCCGINKCDPQFTREQKMIRITNIQGKQISYIKAFVKVPMCRDCNNNSRSSFVFPLVLGSILTIMFLYAFVFGGLTFGSFLLSLLGVLIVSLICWWISSLGIKIIYRANKIGEYKPINIMKRYGWSDKEPTKASKSVSIYTDLQHYKMILEIVGDGEYKVE